MGLDAIVHPPTKIKFAKKRDRAVGERKVVSEKEDLTRILR